MILWEWVEKTDPKQTKKFKRPGGFEGTAINATYQVKRATELWGPIGGDWGYEIVGEGILNGKLLSTGEPEQIHRIVLEVYSPNPQNPDSPRKVKHYGMTTFVGENKRGVFTDEDAPKKSLTDALTKALSMWGFSADVHMGLFDDNKYVESLLDAQAPQLSPLDEAVHYLCTAHADKLKEWSPQLAGCDTLAEAKQVVKAFINAHLPDWREIHGDGITKDQIITEAKNVIKLAIAAKRSEDKDEIL